MPSPVLALPCGSRSITRTRFRVAARAVARLIAVVVLPTPPFWLATAMTRGRVAPPAAGAGITGIGVSASGMGTLSGILGVAGASKVFHAKDHAVRVDAARHGRRAHHPAF